MVLVLLFLSVKATYLVLVAGQGTNLLPQGPDSKGSSTGVPQDECVPEPRSSLGQAEKVTGEKRPNWCLEE